MAAERLCLLHLLGIGGVGKQVIRQILDNQEMHKETMNLSIRIVSLTDSTATVAHPNSMLPLSTERLTDILNFKTSGKQLKDYKEKDGSVQIITPPTRYFDDGAFQKQHQQQQHQHVKTVIADCSASDDSYKLLLKAMEEHKASVVLANKKPLVASMDVYNRLTKNWRENLRWESTVGAGVPIIAAQMRLIAAGDTINKMVGTFSGTLGYVMTGIEHNNNNNNNNFSAVVKEAFDKGYTEPDPRDDLGGVDVARKALILARAIGISMEMSDVLKNVVPLYPPTFASLSVSDFMARLHELDADYSAKTKAAAQEGKTLRYAASISKNSDGGGVVVSVGPLVVERESPLGVLKGTNNMIEFHTKWYKSSPLVLQGAGAGGDQTAAGVLADIVELAHI